MAQAAVTQCAGSSLQPAAAQGDVRAAVTRLDDRQYEPHAILLGDHDHRRWAKAVGTENACSQRSWRPRGVGCAVLAAAQ